MLEKQVLDSLINRFIKDEISLEQKDIEQSAKSREWVLEKVKNKIEEKLKSPELYKDERFLKYGSYFTGLKVSNVDEYDVLVIIDSNTGIYSKDGISYGTGLGTASPNHKYDSKFKKNDDSGVSPTKMLNWLKGILEEVAESYNGETPIKDRQAITLKIKSKDIKIDFVPAGIFKRDTDGTVFYNIPDGTKSNSWIITNPKLDAERIKYLACQKTDFKNVIRINKYIRDKYGMLLKSYIIQESACDHAESSYWYISIFDNLIAVLNSLKNALESGFLNDGYDGETNLLKNVSSSDYYASRITKLIDALEDLQYEDDKEVAYSKLRKLLSNNELSESTHLSSKSNELLTLLNQLNRNERNYF